MSALHWTWSRYVIAGIVAAGIIFVIVRSSSRSLKHDFTGQCTLCHEEIPKKGTPFREVKLKGSSEQLCASCHHMNKNASHPVGVKPNKPISMQQYLDAQGNVTCLTCHDVHKEDKGIYGEHELKSLLRGHASGRAFCYICHNEAMLKAGWQHTNAINYAHMSDQLIQQNDGALLDTFSVECLSCHDGVVSKMTDIAPRAGEFRHSIGLSHPIGVEYPIVSVRQDFVNISALPSSIKLFDGKVGCLSCHNPYGGKKNFLVMENRGSALCISCHRK